jgi:DNA-binding transcriptional LysR family regulator
MQLTDIAVLATIASCGSLSGAARQLGTSPMSVSRRLAALEHDLGVRLLHRTTRSVALTPEGEAFLPYAQTMLEAEEAARAMLAPTSSGASGTLRMTAPSVFGQAVIMPLIPAFLARNPASRVDLAFSDSLMDVVGQGLDLAIRIAPMRDSGLIARRLADNPRLLCASPDYLARHGVPKVMKDLVGHSCLVLHAMPQWPFVVDGQVRLLSVHGSVSASSVDSIRAACLQGLGLAMLTYWDVRQQLEEGSLLRVDLLDADMESLSVWAAIPSRHFTPLRVTAFLDILESALDLTR